MSKVERRPHTRSTANSDAYTVALRRDEQNHFGHSWCLRGCAKWSMSIRYAMRSNDCAHRLGHGRDGGRDGTR